MIAALPNFQVSSVGKRQADAHKNFVSRQRGDINHLDAEIFAAIQHGRSHLRRHRYVRLRLTFTSSPASVFFGVVVAHACVIKIFSDSAVGFAAEFQALLDSSQRKAVRHNFHDRQFLLQHQIRCCILDVHRGTIAAQNFFFVDSHR